MWDFLKLLTPCPYQLLSSSSPTLTLQQNVRLPRNFRCCPGWDPPKHSLRPVLGDRLAHHCLPANGLGTVQLPWLHLGAPGCGPRAPRVRVKDGVIQHWGLYFTAGEMPCSDSLFIFLPQKAQLDASYTCSVLLAFVSNPLFILSLVSFE